jgi:Putative transmembrane protein (PGPGW)
MRYLKIAGGFALLLLGISMLALPGPGLLTIVAGLAILAAEFIWARQLLDRLGGLATRIGHKLRRRHGNGPEAEESNRSSGH